MHTTINENGQLVVDFLKQKNIIKSTYFQRKEIHKGTWRAPNSEYTNQIDHVLIIKEERGIRNVRLYRPHSSRNNLEPTITYS